MEEPKSHSHQSTPFPMKTVQLPLLTPNNGGRMEAGLYLGRWLACLHPQLSPQHVVTPGSYALT